MATLVHDDVLDAAPLRRGRPDRGRDGRPGAGDGARRPAASRAPSPSSPAAAASARSQLLAQASVGLALGELAQRRDEFDLGVGAERYLERCALKTASLFECACLIGRADGRRARLGATYGREIGLAFQLLDDVLDVAGPPERTGKARGTDLLDGTVTLPLILARERDPGPGDRSTCARWTRPRPRRSATASPRPARWRTCARDARARVERRQARACGGRDSTEAQRELLLLVADGVVERYS